MTIESQLTDKQKLNLDHARALMGFKHRQELFHWFADNSVRLVKIWNVTINESYSLREEMGDPTKLNGPEGSE